MHRHGSILGRADKPEHACIWIMQLAMAGVGCRKAADISHLIRGASSFLLSSWCVVIVVIVSIRIDHRCKFRVLHIDDKEHNDPHCTSIMHVDVEEQWEDASQGSVRILPCGLRPRFTFRHPDESDFGALYPHQEPIQQDKVANSAQDLAQDCPSAIITI